MLKQIYLTIDDSPSIHMDKKVSFLKKHNIPALFYARGEYIEKHPNQIINAIQHGFVIGNHSYSHPYFSTLTLDHCFEEVLKTESLINQCYQIARQKRPCKIVRLPFADRGAGPKAKAAESDHEKIKVKSIQDFLRRNDFIPINFYDSQGDFIDSYWDWDTEDYKTKHVTDSDRYLDKMNTFLKVYDKHTAIILLHDFDHNHHLFDESMKFLLSRNIQFLNYQTIKELC